MLLLNASQFSYFLGIISVVCWWMNWNCEFFFKLFFRCLLSFWTKAWISMQISREPLPNYECFVQYFNFGALIVLSCLSCLPFFYCNEYWYFGHALRMSIRTNLSNSFNDSVHERLGKLEHEMYLMVCSFPSKLKHGLSKIAMILSHKKQWLWRTLCARLFVCRHRQ